MASKILIVDDSSTIRFKIRNSFENHFESDCFLHEASNGKEALQWLTQCRENLPDVILLDRNMPFLTGDDVIRILKSDKLWKRIPVLIITTHGEIQEIVKGLSDLQADDYLAKPFNPQELVVRAKVLIRIKKAEDASRQLNEDLQAALVSEKEAFEALKTTKIELAETAAIAEMTQVFEKFVPKPFLSRIAPEGIQNISIGKADTTFLTILFSDIRSFTTLSETMQPQELLNFLNSYFKRMSGSIHENNGFVDKFIGDAIMALFDRHEDDAVQHPQDAILSAIGMQEAVEEYNVHRKNVGHMPIEIGVGIHSGSIILGTVGWEDRMDSTVLGDNVNLAARVEGLTKYYGAPILITDATLQLLNRDFRYRELDWVRVKGKTKPVQIFEILEGDSLETLDAKEKSGKAIKNGLEHRKQKNWNRAIHDFERALSEYPDDRAVFWHLHRCRILQNRTWPKDWDGAVDLDEK